MKIIHPKNINFSIGSDGNIICIGTWRIKPDGESDVMEERSGFRQEVEAWAGKIGDAFRTPTTDLQGYNEDPDYIVAEISFKSVEFSIYEVTFTGQRKHLIATMVGGIHENINHLGERERDARWMVHADSLDGWLPKIGDILNWAGADYRCESINCQQLACGEWEVALKARDITVLMIGNPALKRNCNLESSASAKWRVNKSSVDSFLTEHAVNTPAAWAGENYIITDIAAEPDGVLGYYVTLEAKDMSVLMIGNPSFKRNSNLESSVSAKWRVGKESITSFLTEHELNSVATKWAGEGYYVTDISSEPNGAQGYHVTVEARHVGVRQVEVKRCETFAGYDLFGNPRREVVWTGRWRVHRDNRQTFENITGLSAADWAEDGYIVTSVEPSRISDMEYEYKVDAKSPENSNLAAMHYKNDRTNLASREDVMVDSATFILSAEQCGLFKNGEGQYEPIEEWNSSMSCPFQTDTPLAEEIIDRELLCALLTVSTYRKGETRRHVAREVQWANSSRIVNNADGHVGDWRKIEIRADILNDSKGDVWTKVTKKYMHAPGGCKWNPNFWK